LSIDDRHTCDVTGSRRAARHARLALRR